MWCLYLLMLSNIEPSMSLTGKAGIHLPTVYSAMLIKYSFSMSAIWLRSLTISLFSLKMTWQLLVLVLWAINGLTVFQNSLLVIMPDWHLFTKYRFTAFRQSLMHRFLCLLKASLSLSFLVLLYFVLSWDLFIIALIRSLFMKGAWFPLMILIFRGGGRVSLEPPAVKRFVYHTHYLHQICS